MILQDRKDLQTYLMHDTNFKNWKWKTKTTLWNVLCKIFMIAFNISNINLTCEINMDGITLKPIKYEFNDGIQNHKRNDKKLHIFELLIKQLIMLHILEGTLGNGKTFFIKYSTQYFQM